MNDYFFKKIKLFYRFFKIDTPLLILIALLSSLGLMILYSSSGGSLDLVYRQLNSSWVSHICYANCCPDTTTLFNEIGANINGLRDSFLLILVLLFGSYGGGAQRWLNLGLIRFPTIRN